MKSNKIALIAILLWTVTIAVIAWFFIRGNTVPGNDGRTAVVLSADERDLVLREMRGLLAATHGIMEGLIHEDMQQVAKSSRSAGMAVAADVNPTIITKLPLPFKKLGMSVHQEMDEITKAAESGKPAPELMKMLSGTVSKCVACHAAWQIKTGNAAEK
ncbi:MAG: hypothetical protein PHT15_09390 [Gallionellaceae bacterium]|nr:hypothetical protein [Gallionellaceae bacterium]